MKNNFIDEEKKAVGAAAITERFSQLKCSEIVLFLMKKNGYTYAEIAAVLTVHAETVKSWVYGKRIPNEATRFRVIETFADPKVQPPGKVLQAVKDTHHMHWEAERGWTVRFTIMLNKKLVGKRRKIRLRTHDLSEALKRRDIAISCYANLGFEIANRIQRRAKK